MLYFWNPDYSLISNMMIDSSSWSCWSRRSLWSHWLFSSVHTIQGREYHRFGIFFIPIWPCWKFYQQDKWVGTSFKKVWEDKASTKDNRVALSSCFWGSAGSSRRASERAGLPKSIQKGQAHKNMSEKGRGAKKISIRVRTVRNGQVPSKISKEGKVSPIY